MKRQLLKKSVLALLVVSNTFLLYATQKPVNIIPMPNSIIYHEGVHQLSSKQLLTLAEKGTETEFGYLKQELKKTEGITFQTTKNRRKATVTLSIDTLKTKESESYELHITPTTIQISGHDNAGVFYGIQTLLQLVNNHRDSFHIQLPCVTIKDAPRFKWRSFMLDEARFFKGAETVKQLLDDMAELKMNIFHWHLTDDQGWRVESKKFPLLTEIGSKRTDTQSGGWNSPTSYGVAHQGFYTQAQIKEILKYARERHIKIIPEIGMPGHTSAAIASYPWLGSTNDTIQVPTTFGKHYAVLNVTHPKVISFLQDLIDEMLELFETDVIHIGGDEVRFTQWEQNEAITRYKKEQGFTSYMDIQIDFTNKLSKYIASKNSRMLGWNEILGNYQHKDDNIQFDNPTQKLASNVIVHFWVGNEAAIIDAAKQGYSILNSHSNYTYLDYNYNAISLQKAYSFNPVPNNLPLEYTDNILGLGCQMWGEWIPTVASMQQQIYPRIAAYAETGWTEQAVKDYEHFLKRLEYVKRRWKLRGINVYEKK